MQSGDQRRVFFRPPSGKRKIVLSTNLAETSITIDDIVFVIDTGKVKVKSFDALTGVSALKAEWVPQVSFSTSNFFTFENSFKCIFHVLGFSYSTQRKGRSLQGRDLLSSLLPSTLRIIRKVSQLIYF